MRIGLVAHLDRRRDGAIPNSRDGEVFGTTVVDQRRPFVGIGKVSVPETVFEADGIVEGDGLVLTERESLHLELTGILVVRQFDAFQQAFFRRFAVFIDGSVGSNQDIVLLVKNAIFP